MFPRLVGMLSKYGQFDTVSFGVSCGTGIMSSSRWEDRYFRLCANDGAIDCVLPHASQTSAIHVYARLRTSRVAIRCSFVSVAAFTELDARPQPFWFAATARALAAGRSRCELEIFPARLRCQRPPKRATSSASKRPSSAPSRLESRPTRTRA